MTFRELAYKCVASMMATLCLEDMAGQPQPSRDQIEEAAPQWDREARAAVDAFLDGPRSKGLSFKDAIVAIADDWQHRRRDLNSDFPLAGAQ